MGLQVGSGFEAAKSEQIMESVRRVVGEDVVLLGTALFAKYPQDVG